MTETIMQNRKILIQNKKLNIAITEFHLTTILKYFVLDTINVDDTLCINNCNLIEYRVRKCYTNMPIESQSSFISIRCVSYMKTIRETNNHQRPTISHQ